MKRLLAMTLLTAACSFPTPSEQLACRTDDDCADGRVCTMGYCVLGGGSNVPEIDAPDIDSGTDCMSFTSRHFDACMIPAPSGDLDVTMPGVYTLDTQAGSLTPPGGMATALPNRATANGLVISIGRLHVAAGATLRIVGTNAVIIASWSSIEIEGTIDASSGGTALTRGPGANPTTCANHAAVAGGSNNGGAGGGGGGGGQGAGGRGGIGDNGGGGLGGTAIMAPLLGGGCAGATGGVGSSAPGTGGDGGGAVQLTARLSMTLAGTAIVHAGGAGGKPAGNSGDGGGGGGGGSGGMVGLEAPMLSVASGAILAANGGAGGEGGGNTGTGGTGANGKPSAVAATCPNSGSGGNGGAGSAGAALAGGLGGNDTSGGGGAGGGAGFITIKAATKTIDPAAIISPPATIIP